MKLLIIALFLLAILIGLHYNSEAFRSPARDDTCPRGQFSKKTGGACTGPSDKIGIDDLPETAIGATGERYNIGTYDRYPNADEIDYTDTDVLDKPAGRSGYSSWLTDPETNGALYDDIEYGYYPPADYRYPSDYDDYPFPSYDYDDADYSMYRPSSPYKPTYTCKYDCKKVSSR